MQKKLLRNLFCSLALAAGIFLLNTTMAKAAAPKTVASGNAGANISWTLYDDGKLEFIGSGAMPDYYDEESGEITYDQSWYRYRRSTSSIIIGDGITSIGAGAFADFAETKITWPKTGLTKIGRAAFMNNSSLTEAVIPASVNVIGAEAFKNCKGLKRIEIKGSVPTISKEAFTGMTNAIITVASGCTTVDSQAFFGSAERIEFPASVTSIAADALDEENPWKQVRGGSAAVKRLAYKNSIPYIDINEDNVIDSRYITLATSSYSYTGKKIIPEVVVKYVDGGNTTTLYKDKDYTLNFNKDTSTGLGKHSVEVIGIGAFSFDKTLSYTIVANLSECKIKLGYTSTPADGTAKKPSVKITTNGLTLKEGTHYTLSYSNNIKAGTATVTITGKSKNYCTGSAKANFTIFNKARFYYDDCIYIITSKSEDKMEVMLADADPVAATFKVPDTVEYDGDDYKVVEIGQYAFKNIKLVTRVDLGKNVRKIKTGAFYGCSNLSKVTLNANLEYIGDKAFIDCKKLKSVNIGAKVKSIGKSAFLNCTSLSKIKLQPDSLTANSIGDNAFRNISKKAVVSVNANKVSYYKKLLKKKGLNGSSQKVTAIK